MGNPVRARGLLMLGFLSVFGLLANVRPAAAQVTTALAQLNGTVRDENGAVVAKATVSVKELATNRLYSTTSNDAGYYVLLNLPPGQYELSSDYTGFGKYTRTGVVLSVGQVATIDIVLKAAARSETVVVTTEAPPVEPTRTEISQVVNAHQIESLPISGRQFIDFALLTPGVATGRTSLQSTFTDPETVRISFGGQRDLNNGVTVDGADNLDEATGSQRATPSQEAVSEFRVVNNSFGAEYGRALGGIVNIVTKSGTNDFHGSLYDYLRNNATDARSILTLPGFNTLRQNQFGFTLGGPVKKDRTFFFMNYEGQRRAQSPTYPGVLVDNIAAINAVKRSFGIAPENLSVLKSNNYDNGFFRIDHQINEKNQLMVHYFIEDSRNQNMLVGETLDGGGIGAPSSGRNGLLRDQALVGTLTSQLTPNVVNSALVQWARRHYGFPGVTGQPNLDIPNLLLFGHNFGAFDRTDESRFQFSDSISWVKGSHLAKFGFDSNYIQNFVIWPGFTPSRIIFPSLPDFLASSMPFSGGCPPPLVGLPPPCIVAFFWGAPIGSGPFNPNASSPPISTDWQNAYRPDQAQNFFVHLNHSYYGFFGQDQWKVTPKFTVNYGMRWDFETGLGALVNPDYRNFAPRVGLAYSPDPKTVIRAGYGIFFDKYSQTFFFVSLPQRPLMIPGLPTSTNMQTGTWLLNSMFLGPPPCMGSGCPPPPQGVVGPPTIDSAFANLITSGAFPQNLPIFQGGSVVDRHSRTPYSEQASLDIDRQIGKGLVVSAGYLFVAGHKLVRPEDLNIGPPIGTLPDGKLLYNFSLVNSGGIFYYTDSSGNSVYHGMTLSVTERAGQYFRINANYTFSKTLDDGTFTTFVSTPQSLTQRGLERAYSNQDVRNRFVANFTADGPSNTFLRNFELSSIITLQSARPFTMFVGFDANSDGNPVTDRVGLSARNTFRGDAYQSVDMRLSRIFNFNERMKLQLLVEAFNLFNRPNVDEVFTVYGAPDFIGSVPQHYKDGIVDPANSSFGAPRTVFNPRQIQFAAKFTF